MKVLVLGGTRFIGRRIAQRLSEEHSVTLLNRGSNEQAGETYPHLVADRNDSQQVAMVLRDAAFDAVVDVSGLSPRQVSAVVSSLSNRQAVHYIYISSAAVYRRGQLSGALSESTSLGGDPVWGDYGTDKYECEEILQDAGLGKLTVFRPPYVYGPNNNEERERALWGRILNGHPIFVPAEGRSRLQFCHVDYLAEAVAAACEGKIPADAYNVGEPRSYSLLEYVALLGAVVQREPQIELVKDTSVPARAYFPFRDIDMMLDVQKLSLMMARTDVALQDGLAAAFPWFRENHALSDEPSPCEVEWRQKIRDAGEGVSGL